MKYYTSDNCHSKRFPVLDQALVVTLTSILKKDFIVDELPVGTAVQDPRLVLGLGVLHR